MRKGSGRRRLEVPHDSPQCVFCCDLAKVAPITGFFEAILRVLETADSMAEGAGFEPMVRFLTPELQNRSREWIDSWHVSESNACRAPGTPDATLP